MMLELWNKVRAVPESAQKPINGGRLKGKTDINPVWRLKTLTENFGPCGVGWGYEILSQRLETGANGEIAAFVNIHLWVKTDGLKSEPIPGSGGSMFISKESGGLYTDDECFKKALTDAISVACKALGIGADVYWDKDITKYDKPQEAEFKCCVCGKLVTKAIADGSKAANNGKIYCTGSCKAKDHART